MSNHTKGPWDVLPDVDFYIRRIFADSHFIGVIGNSDDTIDVTIANAKRIVDCVNALEGLSNDALDGGWNFKDMSKHCWDVEQQRDELLEALELLIDDLALRAELKGEESLDVSDGRLLKAQRAIAKARGEE